jgi:hypothetical protein
MPNLRNSAKDDPMSAALRQEAPRDRGFRFPLLISSLLHALLVLVFCAVSSRWPDASSHIVDTAVTDRGHPITLGLVSLPAGLKPEAPAQGSLSEEQEFHVTVLPTPAFSEGPPVAAPRVLLPPSLGNVGTSPSSDKSGPGDAKSGSGTSGFLRTAAPVRSVVYVIDCSMSMGGPDEQSHKFALARRELLASLHQLSEGTLFQVIPYNHHAEPLRIDGQTGLVPKNDRNEQATADALAQQKPTGWTLHGPALRRGLVLRPEVLFFVTDGDDLKSTQEREATAFNSGRTVIQVVELSWRPSPPDCPLRALARNNHGTYRHVPVGR